MPTKKDIKAAEVAANRRVAFDKKVRSLLGHVAQRLSQKELTTAYASAGQYGYTEAAEAFAAEVASREPVGKALHEMKAEAVKFAEQEALRIVERVRGELEAIGWDAQALAPYPGYRDPDQDGKKRKHRLVSSLTEADPEKGYQIRSGRSNEPYIVVMSEKAIERFANQAREMAAYQYDAFICKLVGKVGEVESAAISGSHIWAHSILFVTKADGSSERWKTQQIVNYSSLGNAYLQWPSRIVKGSN